MFHCLAGIHPTRKFKTAITSTDRERRVPQALDRATRKHSNMHCDFRKTKHSLLLLHLIISVQPAPRSVLKPTFKGLQLFSGEETNRNNKQDTDRHAC